jgi:chemotaxis response regulator CheB
MAELLHSKPMHCLDIVAIGASAGGVEAIPRLLEQLPRERPCGIASAD